MPGESYERRADGKADPALFRASCHKYTGKGIIMDFITASHTDAGIKKKKNEDSMLIEQARTEQGKVLFAAVCDGMGGLQKGEVASSALIQRFSDWFYQEFPVIFYQGFEAEFLRKSWEQLVNEMNYRLASYGAGNGFGLGTTCVAFLAFDHTYYIMSVGDSRVYLLSDRAYQLTKDQSYVQREVDLGRMTQQQAACDPNRSVLLQCIGAGRAVRPAFSAGRMKADQCFLLCSDGFSHVISPSEIYDSLCPQAQGSAKSMKKNLFRLTELIKARGEKDNITALLLKTV